MPSSKKNINATKLELLRSFFTKIKPLSIHKFDVEFKGLNMKQYILSLLFRAKRCKYKSTLQALLEKISEEFPICAEFIQHFSKTEMNNTINNNIKKPLKNISGNKLGHRTNRTLLNNNNNNKRRKVNVICNSNKKNKSLLPLYLKKTIRENKSQKEQEEEEPQNYTKFSSQNNTTFSSQNNTTFSSQKKKEKIFQPDIIVYAGLSHFLFNEIIQLREQAFSLEEAIRYAKTRLENPSKIVLNSFSFAV